MAVAYHEDGRTTGQELHRGTKEECDAVADRMPGVAATAADVVRCEYLIGTEEQWAKATDGVVERPS
jgi:hypothetical protein